MKHLTQLKAILLLLKGASEEYGEALSGVILYSYFKVLQQIIWVTNLPKETCGELLHVINSNTFRAIVVT